MSEFGDLEISADFEILRREIKTIRKPSVLHLKAIAYMDKNAHKDEDGWIDWDEVYRLLRWLFNIGRGTAGSFIRELYYLDLIEVWEYHGLKIKNACSARWGPPVRVVGD